LAAVVLASVALAAAAGFVYYYALQVSNLIKLKKKFEN
jgi:hypothetical protein